MSAHTQALGGLTPLSPKPRKGYWQRMGGKFLVLSVIAHALFFAGAAYYFIQYITPKRQVFKSVALSSNADKDINHPETVIKQRQNSSAPAPIKPVVSPFGQIKLPPPPDITTKAIIPTQIPGTNGVNPFGPGIGPGVGGPGIGGPGTNGLQIPPYGIKNGHPGMLKGTFYDLKFLRGGEPAPDVGRMYAEDITKFVMGGWNESYLGKYLRGPAPLYVTQVFFPVIDTNDAPKAFGSPRPDSPGKWCVVYKGEVSPPESGIYHFVAAGDDDMIIRFNNQTVLFHCEHIQTPPGLQGEEYHYAGERLTYARSLPLSVDAAKSYPIEILIGDDIPNKTFAKVLVEKEGVTYEKDPAGGPVLPVFAVDAVTASGTETPAHTAGPVWQGKKSDSALDMFDQ